MVKTLVAEKHATELMPDEVGAVKELVREFMGKIQAIDNEIETLKGDRKEVFEEYRDKLDTKTLQIALRVLKLQASVERKDAYDLFLEALAELDDVR